MVGHLLVEQLFGDHPDHVAATGHGGLGRQAHGPDAAATEHHIGATLGRPRPALRAASREHGVVARTGPQ
ncbi:MAG: hypothetical protein R2789_17990 [Microthrixaceae bacterium]